MVGHGRPPQFLRRVHNRPRLRRKSRIVVILQLCGVVAGLGVGGIGAYFAYDWALRAEAFALERITLDPIPPELEPAVRAALEPTLGLNLLVMDLEQVKRRIEAIPQVRTATVRRVLPDALEIGVRARTAWARLETPDAAYVIDREGTVLAHASDATSALPRIEIRASIEDRIPRNGRVPDVTGAEWLPAAVRVSDWLLEVGANGFGRVDRILLDETGVTVVLLDAPWSVRLGDAVRLDEKLESMRALMLDVPPAPSSVVDLRFRDMIVVTDSALTARDQP